MDPDRIMGMGLGGAVSSIAEFTRLPIPGGVFDVDGTVVAMNDAAEVLVGRPAERVLGLKAWDLAPGAEHLWDEVLAAARARGPYHGEIVIATPNEPRHVHYVFTVREHEGRPYVLLFALETLGERPIGSDLEERLHALGSVAAGIAHDFNNQLVSVLAEASAAREDPGLSAASREALGRIEAAAHRMTKLARQLLAHVGRGPSVTEQLDSDEPVAGVKRERTRSTSQQPALPTLHGVRILVADDEPSVRATVKRLLDRRGATVVTAADGAEARARLAEGSYQLVVFDVMMPVLTGYQLLPLARELQPGAKVMLMSGNSDHDRGAGSDEPDSFLAKPFNAEHLDRAIDDLLGPR